MAIFHENDRSPIVAELIRQDFDFDESEALRIIDIDETAHSLDSTIALGAGAACIAATAGTIALSGLTLGIIIPLVGIGVCGCSFWNSKLTARDREMEQQFLNDHPEVFGKISQKLRGGESRTTIANVFEQCLRQYRFGDVTSANRLLEQTVSTHEKPQTQAEAIVMHQNNSPTGLMYGSPDAPTVIQPAPPSSSVINGVETIAPRDIATDLGNNPQSALIFGTPGAGKGMTISNAIRSLRAKLPAVTVMMVDPKGDAKERGYWESQVDIFESKPILKTNPRTAAEWMLDCVEKFRRLDGPKLMVWDELYASITVLKSQHVATGKEPFPCLTDFQVFIATHLSLGPSSGIWVWGMSQSANLSDLGLTGGGLSTTRIVALVSPDNTGAIEGLYATKAITAPKGGMDTINSLMEQSPVGRACYDGKTKRWYPSARLENHSGFDRDNADWNNLASPEQPETKKLSVGAVNWERTKAGSPTYPGASEWKKPPSNFREAGPQIGVPKVADFDHEKRKADYENEMRAFKARRWNLREPIEVSAIVDPRPDRLDEFPMVAIVWDYLNGKEPRTVKQITMALRKSEKISEDELRAKLGAMETYTDGISSIVRWGTAKGFLISHSDGSYSSSTNTN